MGMACNGFRLSLTWSDGARERLGQRRRVAQHRRPRDRVVREGDRHRRLVGVPVDPHVDPAVRQIVAVGTEVRRFPQVDDGNLAEVQERHHRRRTGVRTDPQFLRGGQFEHPVERHAGEMLVRVERILRCPSDFGERAAADRHGNRNQAGEPTHRQGVDARLPGVVRREPVIGPVAGQVVLGQCRAGQNSTAEPGAGRAARVVERRRLRGVEHLEGHEVALGGDRRVTQWQRETRPGALGAARELDPVLDLRGRQGQARRLRALPCAVVAIAGNLRRGLRPTLIPQVDVEEDQAGRDAVDVEVVDAGVEREVIGVLDDAEREALPLERSRRRRQRVGAYLRGVHPSELRRHEVDLGRVDDRTAHECAILEFEPVVVGVVAADMCIDHRRHRRDVADASHVPRHHHQAGLLAAHGVAVQGALEVLRPLIGRREPPSTRG